MQLTEEDWRNIEREECKSLAYFARRAWPVLEPADVLMWGWALDAMCEHLEAVSRGEIKRLLINVPPGCMKSLLTSVIWPTWEWAMVKPSLRYVGTSHNQELAIRDSTKCRRLIQSEWYQNLWPLKLTSDQNAKTKFENEKTGFRQASSFSGITGYRGDRVILDDPHSVSDANSPVRLAADVLLFREALPTRVNNHQSAIVVIMQRLAVGDISDVAIELGYDHLCLPMRFEDGRSKWVGGSGDPRKTDGDLLFPERFPEQKVKELEVVLGSYATAGQLQQRPSKRGGGIIKIEWFKYYKTAPRLEWTVITADTAQKTGEQNDYSVFQCWGRSITGQAVLLDLIRGKWEAPELLTQARAFYNKHLHSTHGKLRGMYVEDKVSGTGLIQTLRREGLTCLPVQRGRDKISRGHDAAPFIESGNVLVPDYVPWLADFLGEIESFPAGAHDDQIDPMCDAIDLVQKVRSDDNVTIQHIPTTARWK